MPDQNVPVTDGACERAEPWQRNLAIVVFGSFTTLVAMSLMLPFLPLYVEQLGVSGHAAIVQWSGAAYSAAFFAAGLVAPLWGRLGDRYGRKPMLVRASLGMAVTMSLMGFSQNISQFTGLRLLVGLAGGYSSGAMILIAAQTPKSRSAWALGVLASGVMAGNLAGPLAGGVLPPLIGIRATFWIAGGLIFISFLATAFFIGESKRDVRAEAAAHVRARWSDLPHKTPVVAMLGVGALLLFANMSIEPIITVYVRTLVADPNRVTFVAGLVMSAAALGSIISASQLGKVADRAGYAQVIIVALTVAAVLLVPQAFVSAAWQLIALRFCMGLALGGLLPCISAAIRHNVPDRVVGTVLGLSISAQYAGQVLGPLAGGFVAGHIGMRAVFFATSAVLLGGAAATWRAFGVMRAAA